MEAEKERELGEIAKMVQIALEIQMEAEADLKVRTGRVVSERAHDS